MYTPILVFDIETIPDVQGLRKLFHLDQNEHLTDAQVVEMGQQYYRQKTGSDFFPHHLQKVVVISCLYQDAKHIRIGSFSEPDLNEGKIITEFFKLIDKKTPNLVTWNGGGFDLPVLHYRSLIHGIAAQNYWDTGEGHARSERRFNHYLGRYHTLHLDLMDYMALYNTRAYVPLDQIAKLCGAPGKLGIDGGQVWAQYLAGEMSAIRDYCETDVANTYLVYLRFELMRGTISPEEYAQHYEAFYAFLREKNKPHWQEFLAEMSPTPMLTTFS